MTVETDVALIVGGMAYRGWTKVGVSYGAKQAVRTFAVTATDNQQGFKDQWNFMPGAEAEVHESGELICKGYIEHMSPSYEANNHSVEISGRSKSADTVDSSVDHKTNEFKKKNVEQIAKELDKQNVGFKADGLSDEDMPKLDVFRSNPFETVFAAVDRITRKQGLLLIGQADGSIKITKGGKQRVNGPLVEGDNILGASAVFDDSNKHSEYKVKGQRTFGSAQKGSLQITATEKDSSVKRNRPKHIHQEADIDDKSAQKRAKNHKDRQQGESISASVKVRGWRCKNGLLFKENSLIYVYSPLLKLDMDMLIETVSLTQDLSGSFAQISLVQPQALGSDAGTGSKTDGAWK